MKWGFWPIKTKEWRICFLFSRLSAFVVMRGSRKSGFSTFGNPIEVSEASVAANTSGLPWVCLPAISMSCSGLIMATLEMMLIEHSASIAQPPTGRMSEKWICIFPFTPPWQIWSKWDWMKPWGISSFVWSRDGLQNEWISNAVRR